jgi:hypothetical protein
MQPGKIYNIERYRQAKLIDLSGFDFERKISPTDVDFFVEFGSKEFVVGEFKSLNNDLPYGQRLALSSLLKALAIDKNKKIFGFVAVFDLPSNQLIKGSECLITEYWHCSNPKWVTPSKSMTVKEGIEAWRSFWRNKESELIVSEYSEYSHFPLFQQAINAVKDHSIEFFPRR